MISWDMLAKMLRDMLQEDGLRVCSAPAPAMAAWYSMFGNWIAVLLVWVRKNTYKSSRCFALRRVRTAREGV